MSQFRFFLSPSSTWTPIRFQKSVRTVGTRENTSVPELWEIILASGPRQKAKTDLHWSGKLSPRLNFGPLAIILYGWVSEQELVYVNIRWSYILVGSLSNRMLQLFYTSLDEFVLRIDEIVRYMYPVVLTSSKMDPGLRLMRALWDIIEPALWIVRRCSTLSISVWSRLWNKFNAYGLPPFAKNKYIMGSVVFNSSPSRLMHALAIGWSRDFVLDCNKEESIIGP